MRIGFAIAAYERALVPDQTPWDLFMAGDDTAFTTRQQQGWTMLQNNTVCLNCHVPPLFTDNRFWNIGLRPAGEDIGRQEVTGNPDDAGRFKTPTLPSVGLKTSLMHVGWITSVQDSIDFYNAPPSPQVDPLTGHTQFTQDQTGIHTGNPAVFADYNNTFMPVTTMGGAPFQVPVIDFLKNGLTDPRVANELPPFDRPTLHSEASPADPEHFGTGSPGSGGITPRMIANSPFVQQNTDFKIGVDSAVGGTLAFLGLSLASVSPPILNGSVPIYLDLAQFIRFFRVNLSGVGAGEGYGTSVTSTAGINDPVLIGIELVGQWYVVDLSVTELFAATSAATWTIH